MAVITLVFFVFNRTFNYWKNRGWPHDSPNWIFGNFSGLGTTKHFLHFYRDLYQKYKSVSSVAGLYFFFQPVAFITDLDIAQRILVTDFHNFADRGIFNNEQGDPLSAHLFALDGPRWRYIRNKLSPTFTSGKMKNMFPIVVEVANNFQNVYKKLLKNESIIEIKDLNARFTTDVIGACAFGLDCNSLLDPNADFRRNCGNFFTKRRHHPLIEGFIMSFPKLAEKLNMKFIPQQVSDFFIKSVEETVAYREANNIQRNDFMSMLINLKNHSTIDENGKEIKGITMGQLAAQAFVFFLAGFETSSTTMSFCLYELARNSEIQDTLRSEIKDFLNSEELTYEIVNKMPYLEQIVMGMTLFLTLFILLLYLFLFLETLRKYSVVPDLFRVALNDYKVPNTNFVIEKGTRVMIPADAIHHDSSIYPEPETFNPERFNLNEIKKRHPLTWLPFGGGPRNCIGMRFGKMQVKVGIITLIRNFKFSTCSKTSIPIQIDKTNMLVNPLGGVYLKVEEI